MSLQFILGNSGSGKSHYLYQKIIEESRQHPERNYIIIVPEQFTMQTQRDVVSLHPDGGIMNIDVLSFGRLAHRIFEEVGSDRRNVLTETGKNLMIRRVASLEQEELQVLGGKMKYPGYVSQVKSVLSELMQYEVTDFELEQMEKFAGKRPLLLAKLKDIRRLYRAFLAYQRERFLKPEELLDVLCQVADRSELLKKSVLAFDGFAGFTPSQMKVLEELLCLCPKLYLTVTLDAREWPFGKIGEHELFAPSKKMIRSIEEAAGRAYRRRRSDSGTVGNTAAVGTLDAAEEADAVGKLDAAGKTENAGFLEPPILLGLNQLPRFSEGGALAHLEQNLFRGKKRTFQGEQEEISLHVSPTPVSEVYFAAQTIARLVREQGFRYREIAVITGDLSSYDNYVKKIFPLYEIPAFLDETRHILLNPCLEFIRGAMELAQWDYTSEAVFRFLRTRMAGFTSQELDRLENYVLAAGIQGRHRWEQEWTYRPGKVTEEELQTRNECRVRVMERTGTFAAHMGEKGRTLREYADGLCELLEQCGIQQQLKDREQELMAAGRREEAREYAQIYSILMNLLDEMVDLMGEERMDVREFSEILDAGLAEARVGVIPPGIDQVQVGDIRRSRLANVKVLFFLGLNDGWVPSRGDGGGIVSDMERELLKETGIELAPSARENSYIQRFYLYQNLTKPEKHLYLSWCQGGSDGSVMRPSYLVSTVRRLFPELSVTEEAEAGTSVYQVTSRENGMLFFTRGLQEAKEGRPGKEWEELYGMYRRDPEYQDRVERLVRAAFASGMPERLTYLTSRQLYGETMTNSVTRLEQFAACAFAHFALYGLRLQERELYGVKPVDLGILFHRSMELYSRRLEHEGEDWQTVAEEKQRELMERCVDEITAEYGGCVLRENARSAYTVRRLKRILCRSAWAIHEQLRRGHFRPAGFEVSFEELSDLEAVNVKFGDHGRLNLQGRIDRIDTAEDEKCVYVKIIDYKSGMTQFDPVSLYYGLQLQLVVYLNAALELEHHLHGEKEIVPAGIFYYRMQDPVLDKESGVTGEAARELLLKRLRPDGVLNSDEKIMRMLDDQLSGDSSVVPVGLKKDGKPKASSAIVSTEQFHHLSTFVKKKLGQMGEEILSGEITPSPFVQKTGSACDYCSFGEVCGFDRKLPGMCQRSLPELSKQEVWEAIAAEGREEAQFGAAANPPTVNMTGTGNTTEELKVNVAGAENRAEHPGANAAETGTVTEQPGANATEVRKTAEWPAVNMTGAAKTTEQKTGKGGRNGNEVDEGTAAGH